MRASVLLLLVLVARTAAGEGGASPPPPPTPCQTDLDCPGCGRCSGGVCPQAEWSGTVCMCDDECARTGAGSCDLSDLKPLCGGQCVAATPTRPLACGAGVDTVHVSPLGLAIHDAAGAASVASTQAITFEPVPR